MRIIKSSRNQFERQMLVIKMNEQNTQTIPRHGGRRKGSGRKPLDTADRLRPRTVYLTDEEWQRCQECDITASQYIRLLVQKDIRRRRLREQQITDAQAHDWPLEQG
jgi:hypothetical protein